MLKPPPLNERATASHRRITDAVAAIRSLVYGRAVEEARQPGSFPDGKLAQEIFRYVDGLPDSLIHLERAILDLPIEDEVFICQSCGAVVWQEDGGDWAHRNPQPLHPHAPVPYRFVAAPSA